MSNPSIRGIQEAQAANNRLIAALKPGSAFGRAIQYATIEAHRLSIFYTHVKSGALRASHRMTIRGLRARIYIDQSSVNPKGQMPSIYGVFEHARGGDHAFYEQAWQQGPRIGRAAVYGWAREAGL